MEQAQQHKHHTFDVEIAEQHGVNAAVILYHTRYWVQENKDNDRNFEDGKHWTYNSIKALRRTFTYMSTQAIRTALKRLEDAKLIQSGCFNKMANDTTKWYTLGEEGEKLYGTVGKHEGLACQKQQTDSVSLADFNNELVTSNNPIVKTEQPLPINNTNNNTDIVDITKKQLYLLMPGGIENTSVPTAAPIKIFCEIPCIGDPKVFIVSEEMVQHLQRTYPGIDAAKVVREAAAWNLYNPTNRKTHAGMPRFINKWCKTEQDRSGRAFPTYQQPERLTYQQRKEQEKAASAARLAEWVKREEAKYE